MTVYEEIAFGLENFGIPRDEMKKRIDDALELLDIANTETVLRLIFPVGRCREWRSQVSLR